MVHLFRIERCNYLIHLPDRIPHQPILALGRTLASVTIVRWGFPIRTRTGLTALPAESAMPRLRRLPD